MEKNTGKEFYQSEKVGTMNYTFVSRVYKDM